MADKNKTGICAECYYWDSVNCFCKNNHQESDKKSVFANDTCNLWKKLKSANDKELERRQLADHYVPNMWDEWKKKALRKESQKRQWEI